MPTGTQFVLTDVGETHYVLSYDDGSVSVSGGDYASADYSSDYYITA